MTKRNSQHEIKVIGCIGYVLIPILLWITFFTQDMMHINFTGVINKENGWIMKIAGLLLWAWFNILLIRTSHHFPHLYLWISSMDIMAVGTMLIPYTTPSSIISNLHIVCANAVLILFNIITVGSNLHNLSRLRLYVMLCLPAFFLALTTMSINGICEIVYACGISVYLTHTCITEMKKGQ